MGGLRVWLGCVCTVAALGLGAPLHGQEPGPEDGPLAEAALRLYYDCQGFGCWDVDFFRREIPFVSWVRDREVSDVHVLVTSQTTGGGGQQFRLRYIGRGDFEGREQELVVNTAGDATDDEVRRALVARLRLGLGPYLAQTAMADRLQVRPEGGGPSGGRGPGGPGGVMAPEDDPWDFWSFTLGGSAYLSGESSYSSENLNTRVSANRITDAWKLSFSGRFSRYEQNFELDDTATSTYAREEWSASGLVVKSLTPRFSVGTRFGAGRTTYRNEDFRWNVAPGVEFNAFPYTESSRRSLTFQAVMDLRHWDYEEETIFEETAETRVAGTLSSELEFIQPWGRASISAGHSRYFHDTSKWQSTIGGFIEVRLFKGFSVNMSGEYLWIRDQLYLRLEGATEDEILVRQRALSTDFEYRTSFGISYRFGSIFNNVVNPRFGGGGGGMMMFF